MARFNYTEQKKKVNTYFIQKYLQKYFKLDYENKFYIKLISVQLPEALCKGNTDASDAMLCV